MFFHLMNLLQHTREHINEFGELVVKYQIKTKLTIYDKLIYSRLKITAKLH